MINFRTYPMSRELRERLYREYLSGIPIATTAGRYGCSPRAVQQVIRKRRRRDIMHLPLSYMPNDEEFTARNAEASILGPYPASDTAVPPQRVPKDMPAYIASLYEVPLLTREQEKYLFRKYNYLKFLARQLRDQLDPEQPRMAVMDRIEKLHAQAVQTRNQIIRANLRLVVSIAKRFANNEDSLSEMISEGNASLMRAVEKFDYARGTRFSTYASWAISRNCARASNNRFKRAARFHCGQDELLRTTADERSNPRTRETAQQYYESEIERLLQHLPDRERRILIQHFGLAFPEPAQGLKEIGNSLGISKERIRQLEQRALRRLRQIASAEHMEFAAV